MTHLRIAAAACFAVLSLGDPVLAVPLAPGAPAAVAGAKDALPVVPVQTQCDYRGCFTFGRVQSFRPAYVQPNYRPPGADTPTYYRPRAAGPAPLYNNPPPVRRVLPDQQRVSTHTQWCRNQYRTYNPKTDRFISYEGIYKTCNSPFD